MQRITQTLQLKFYCEIYVQSSLHDTERLLCVSSQLHGCGLTVSSSIISGYFVLTHWNCWLKTDHQAQLLAVYLLTADLVNVSVNSRFIQPLTVLNILSAFQSHRINPQCPGLSRVLTPASCKMSLSCKQCFDCIIATDIRIDHRAMSHTSNHRCNNNTNVGKIK